jgi:hypothetical protein
MTTQSIMRNGTSVRLAYGLLSLFAPKLLFKLSGKPVEPEPRYFNALFGGRDLSVCAATAAALSSGRERDAVLLNLSCEATDLIALLQELRERGGLDQTLVAAIAFNTFGWATWLSAWRRLPA